MLPIKIPYKNIFWKMCVSKIHPDQDYFSHVNTLSAPRAFTRTHAQHRGRVILIVFTEEEKWHIFLNHNLTTFFSWLSHGHPEHWVRRASIFLRLRSMHYAVNASDDRHEGALLSNTPIIEMWTLCYLFHQETKVAHGCNGARFTTTYITF